MANLFLLSALNVSPSNVLTESLVGAVQTSSGVADAGKVVLLDSSGSIDPSLVPPIGSVAFSGILPGTNTQALVMGTGGTLMVSGTGAVQATQIQDVIISGTPPTTGQVLTATSATTANWQTGSGGGGSVNVNGSSVTSPNFGTLPAAPGTNTLITWQVSGSNVSAYAQLPQIFAPISNEFLTGYTASTGVYTAAQPSFANISGTFTSAQAGAGSYAISVTGTATTITGTITFSQVTSVPTFAQNTPAVSHEFLTSYNSSTGVFGQAQPASTDLSDAALLAYLASPSFSGTATFVNIDITGTLKDGTGSVGTSGQVLSSTVTGTQWVSAVSSSINVNSTPVPSPNLQNSASITFSASGSNIQAAAFGDSIFLPETYGALGNGTHDDTTAIQAAISAAASNGGGTVLFGVKTYLVTATLTITASNVCMMGQTAGGPSGGGPSGTIITCNSGSVDIINVGNGGAQIYSNLFKNFCITRSVSPTTGNGFILNSTIDSKMENIWCFDSIICFYHQNAQFCVYTNCFAEWTGVSSGVTGYGFKMVGTNGTGYFSTRMLDCVTVSKISGTFYGMHLSTSGNGISDLFCEGFETAEVTYGVYIDATSSNYNEDIHFMRTIHDNPTISAFYITGLHGNSAYVEINGGYVNNTSSFPAIDIENSAGIIVNNMNFLAVGGTGSPFVLINGSSSKNNIIHSNLMYSGNSSQIMIKLNGTNGNIITNNAVVGSPNSFTTGISLLSSSFNTIEGNTLSGSGTTGISLDASSNSNGGVNVVDPTSITTPLSDSGTGNFVTISASSTAFNAIASGTNTTATMTVGTGGSLVVSGSGIVEATKLQTVVISGSAPILGQVLTATGTAAANWQNPSSGFANPMTTAGDMIFENATPAPDRLPIGATGQVLTVVAGFPAWITPSGGGGGGGGGLTGTLFTNKTLFTSSGRAFSTVYQNTSAQPLIVFGSAVSGGSVMTSVCDASATPSTVVNEVTTASGLAGQFFFVVPPSDYYEISGSSIGFNSWMEMELTSGSVTFSGELSGSRALSTVYHNTRGNALLVIANLSGVSSGTTVSGISDSSATPSTVVWQMQANTTGNQTVWMLIPNGHYYEITCSGAAVANWNEYVFPFSAVKSTDYAVITSGQSQRKQAVGGGTDNAGNNVNPIYLNDSGYDLWVSICDTQTQTGSLLLAANNDTAPSFPSYLTVISNLNTNQNAGFLPVNFGESYQVSRDTGSPTLNHWWEYMLIPPSSGGTGIELQTDGTDNGSQSKLNLVSGTSISLSDNGLGSVTIAVSGGGSGIDLQTNSVDNGSQTKLNLIAGTNVTITDGGTGGVTIDASGSGSSAFNAITSGTNTTATMTVGSGASLVPSGSGVVEATQIQAVVVSGTPPSTGQVLTATSSTAADWQTPSGGGGGGGIYPTLTAPLTTDFTLHNPGGYTVSAADKTSRMVIVGNTLATGWLLENNTVLPSIPYTIDIALIMSADHTIQVANMVLIDSGSGNMRAYGPRVDSIGFNSYFIVIQNWSGPNSPGSATNISSAEYIDGMNPQTALMFFRITDDGTTRTYFWGCNGMDYIAIVTEPTGTFITPTNVGLIFYNGSTTQPMSASFYHYLVTNSILPQHA